MSVYYPSGCDAVIPQHYCDTCEVTEKGRVSSIAFVKNTFAFVDITDATEWQAGFASGDIILIPFTRGTFDGGAEVESPGYGRQQTRLTGYNFTLQYQDPNYRNNCNFYNAIKSARNYKVAYATETQIHLSDNVVSVIPKNPVQDDPTTEVVWDVLVKWAGTDLPCPFDLPEGIFDECVALSS